jgi:osmotically-inducible protein OsmY
MRIETTKSRTGVLAFGALLLVTMAAAGCEHRRDTEVVDTPNGQTATTTDTVKVDHDSLNKAKNQASATANRVGDQLSAAAHDAKASLADAGLTAKVKTRLGTDNRVRASAINVATANRVVTLSGTVASDAERKAAVDVARGTDGVSDVVDHLTVATS